MRKYYKFIALALILSLVVFAAAACGVPDEEEFEEIEEDPIEDDFGFEEDVGENFNIADIQIEGLTLLS